jgi:hypothetical protein
MVQTQTLTYVTDPQHNPLSLHTKLESPSIAKLELHFPRYDLHMIFKGPRSSWSRLLVYV